MFVPELLGYHAASALRAVAGVEELAGLLDCRCLVCRARGGEFGVAELDGADVLRHDLSAQLVLAEQVRRWDDLDQRRSVWHECCSHALYRYEQLRVGYGGWRIPAALRNWYTHAPDPLGRARHHWGTTESPKRPDRVVDSNRGRGSSARS